ncbi:MAG: D-aminoacyl-tRNA deacylase [Actinomycetota bacterium]
MRIVLQRVSRASVRVQGETIQEIGGGLVLLVGAGKDDREGEVDRLAEKIAGLRIFEDGDGKMNLALGDAGGEVLLIPNFTLYGDVRRGRRPSWDSAAAPDVAFERVEALASALEARGVPVRRGAFREHMEVELLNDGPVTLVLDGSELVRS